MQLLILCFFEESHNLSPADMTFHCGLPLFLYRIVLRKWKIFEYCVYVFYWHRLSEAYCYQHFNINFVCSCLVFRSSFLVCCFVSHGQKENLIFSPVFRVPVSVCYCFFSDHKSNVRRYCFLSSCNICNFRVNDVECKYSFRLLIFAKSRYLCYIFSNFCSLSNGLSNRNKLLQTKI